MSTANKKNQLKKEKKSAGGGVFVGHLDLGWRQHLYASEDLGNVNVASIYSVTIPRSSTCPGYLAKLGRGEEVKR